MILPPIAHDVKVISIGMFVPGNQPVVWRGPMLHRALQQFLADVFWGDLDVLLLDLPPGTGDIAISVAQLMPDAEILVVTTPQQAAAEVAERAGAIALQTHQRLVGVVENMSWLELPDGSRLELFGSGGGQLVADSLTRRSAPRSRCSVRSRSTRGCARAATRACPSCSPTPTPRPPWRSARCVARGSRRARRGLAGRSLGLTPAGSLTGRSGPIPPRRTSPSRSGRSSTPGVGKRPRSSAPPAARDGQVASASQGVGLAGSWNGWGTGAITPDCGFAGSSAALRRRVLHQRLAHDPARVVLARVELAPVDVLELGTHLVLELGPGVRRRGCGPDGPCPPSLPAYSGSRSGPSTRMPTTTSTITSQPFTSSISSPPAPVSGQLDAACRVMVTSRRLVATLDLHLDGVADVSGPDRHDQRVGVGDLLALELEDDVAVLEPGLSRRAAGLDATGARAWRPRR